MIEYLLCPSSHLHAQVGHTGDLGTTPLVTHLQCTHLQYTGKYAACLPNRQRQQGTKLVAAPPPTPHLLLPVCRTSQPSSSSRRSHIAETCCLQTLGAMRLDLPMDLCHTSPPRMCAKAMRNYALTRATKHGLLLNSAHTPPVVPTPSLHAANHQ